MYNVTLDKSSLLYYVVVWFTKMILPPTFRCIRVPLKMGYITKWVFDIFTMEGQYMAGFTNPDSLHQSIQYLHNWYGT